MSLCSDMILSYASFLNSSNYSIGGKDMGHFFLFCLTRQCHSSNLTGGRPCLTSTGEATKAMRISFWFGLVGIKIPENNGATLPESERWHRLIAVPTTSSQSIHCDYDIIFTDVHGVQKCPARQFFGVRQASVQKILKHCFFACCQYPQC